MWRIPEIMKSTVVLASAMCKYLFYIIFDRISSCLAVFALISMFSVTWMFSAVDLRFLWSSVMCVKVSGDDMDKIVRSHNCVGLNENCCFPWEPDSINALSMTSRLVRKPYYMAGPVCSGGLTVTWYRAWMEKSSPRTGISQGSQLTRSSLAILGMVMEYTSVRCGCGFWW